MTTQATVSEQLRADLVAARAAIAKYAPSGQLDWVFALVSPCDVNPARIGEAALAVMRANEYSPIYNKEMALSAFDKAIQAASTDEQVAP